MSAIFPPLDRGGVPAGPNVECAFSPTHPTTGEGPLYYSSDCTTVLTSCAQNSLISEILAAVDALGFGFNANSVTNLGDALNAHLAHYQGLVDGKIDRAGDTMTGPLNVVCPPTANDNAACKLYVDQTAQAAADACCTHMQGQLDTVEAGLQADINNRVRRDGDQMTGPLILSGDPTVPNGAATKNYVDSSIGRIIIAPEPPTGIEPERLWWDSSTGILYVRYDDGDSVQWVQACGGSDSSGGGGGAIGPGVGLFLPLSGGTLSGPLMLSGNATAAFQAVPLQQLNSLLAGHLPLAGGTLAGPLMLSGNPASAMQAATKGYVDDQDATLLSRSGGTLTGPLTLSGNPVSNLQAATKSYVDTQEASLRSHVDTQDAAITAAMNNHLLRSGSAPMTGELILAGNPVAALGAVPLQLLNSEIAALRAYVDEQIADTRIYVDEQITDVRTYVDEQITATRDYVDEQIALALTRIARGDGSS